MAKIGKINRKPLPLSLGPIPLRAAQPGLLLPLPSLSSWAGWAPFPAAQRRARPSRLCSPARGPAASQAQRGASPRRGRVVGAAAMRPDRHFSNCHPRFSRSRRLYRPRSRCAVPNRPNQPQSCPEYFHLLPQAARTVPSLRTFPAGARRGARRQGESPSLSPSLFPSSSASLVRFGVWLGHGCSRRAPCAAACSGCAPCLRARLRCCLWRSWCLSRPAQRPRRGPRPGRSPGPARGRPPARPSLPPRPCGLWPGARPACLWCEAGARLAWPWRPRAAPRPVPA